jgi:hypothetical protein
MPEFLEVPMRMCASIDGPMAVRVGDYEVTGLFSERNWPACSCPGYTFAPRVVDFGGRMVPHPCKHIRLAQAQACGWHELTGERAPRADGLCPECGGPTVVVRVAV